MSVSKAVANDSPAPAPAPATPDIGVVESPQPGDKVTRIEATPAPAGAGGDPRPAWLPEKFKSPEDLSRAYGELERRLGVISQAPAAPAMPVAPASSVAPVSPADPAAPTTAPSAGDIIARMTQEFASTGAVSDKTRQEFTQRTGLPDGYIDQQLAFLHHQDQQARSIATQRLGGEAAVRELTDWARGHLQPAEREAFNSLVYSGDEVKARLAIDGLAAKYEAEVGRAPRIIAGRRPQNDHGGVIPFQSEHELHAAMRDKRYREEPAYRAQVEDRLRVAQKMGLIR